MLQHVRCRRALMRFSLPYCAVVPSMVESRLAVSQTGNKPPVAPAGARRTPPPIIKRSQTLMPPGLEPATPTRKLVALAVATATPTVSESSPTPATVMAPPAAAAKPAETATAAVATAESDVEAMLDDDTLAIAIADSEIEELSMSSAAGSATAATAARASVSDSSAQPQQPPNGGLNAPLNKTRVAWYVKRMFRRIFQGPHVEHVQQLPPHAVSYAEPTLRTAPLRFPPRFIVSSVAWRARRHVTVIFPEVRMPQSSADCEAVATAVACMAAAPARLPLMRWIAVTNERCDKFAVKDLFASAPVSVSCGGTGAVGSAATTDSSAATPPQVALAAAASEPEALTLQVRPAPMACVLGGAIETGAPPPFQAMTYSASLQAQQQQQLSLPDGAAPLRSAVLDSLEQLADELDLAVDIRFACVVLRWPSPPSASSSSTSASEPFDVDGYDADDVPDGGGDVPTAAPAADFAAVKKRYLIRATVCVTNVWGDKRPQSPLAESSFSCDARTMDAALELVAARLARDSAPPLRRLARLGELAEVAAAIRVASADDDAAPPLGVGGVGGAGGGRFGEEGGGGGGGGASSLQSRLAVTWRTLPPAVPHGSRRRRGAHPDAADEGSNNDNTGLRNDNDEDAAANVTKVEVRDAFGNSRELRAKAAVTESGASSRNGRKKQQQAAATPGDDTAALIELTDRLSLLHAHLLRPSRLRNALATCRWRFDQQRCSNPFSANRDGDLSVTVAMAAAAAASTSAGSSTAAATPSTTEAPSFVVSLKLHNEARALSTVTASSIYDGVMRVFHQASSRHGSSSNNHNDGNNHHRHRSTATTTTMTAAKTPVLSSSQSSDAMLAESAAFVPVLSPLQFPTWRAGAPSGALSLTTPFDAQRTAAVCALINGGVADEQRCDSVVSASLAAATAASALAVTDRGLGVGVADLVEAVSEFYCRLLKKPPSVIGIFAARNRGGGGAVGSQADRGDDRSSLARALSSDAHATVVTQLVSANSDWLVLDGAASRTVAINDPRVSTTSSPSSSESGGRSDPPLFESCVRDWLRVSRSGALLWCCLQAQRVLPFSLASAAMRGGGADLAPLLDMRRSVRLSNGVVAGGDARRSSGVPLLDASKSDAAATTSPAPQTAGGGAASALAADGRCVAAVADIFVRVTQLRVLLGTSRSWGGQATGDGGGDDGDGSKFQVPIEFDSAVACSRNLDHARAVVAEFDALRRQHSRRSIPSETAANGSTTTAKRTSSTAAGPSSAAARALTPSATAAPPAVSAVTQHSSRDAAVVRVAIKALPPVVASRRSTTSDRVHFLVFPDTGRLRGACSVVDLGERLRQQHQQQRGLCGACSVVDLGERLRQQHQQQRERPATATSGDDGGAAAAAAAARSAALLTQALRAGRNGPPPPAEKESAEAPENPVWLWRILAPSLSSSSVASASGSATTAPDMLSLAASRYPLAAALDALGAFHLQQQRVASSNSDDAAAAAAISAIYCDYGAATAECDALQQHFANAASSLFSATSQTAVGGADDEDGDECRLLAFAFAHLASTWVGLPPVHTSTVRVVRDNSASGGPAKITAVGRRGAGNAAAAATPRYCVEMSLPGALHQILPGVVCGVGSSRVEALRNALLGNFGVVVAAPRSLASASPPLLLRQCTFRVSFVGQRPESALTATQIEASADDGGSGNIADDAAPALALRGGDDAAAVFLRDARQTAPAHELVILYFLLLDLTAASQQPPRLRAISHTAVATAASAAFASVGARSIAVAAGAAAAATVSSSAADSSAFDDDDDGIARTATPPAVDNTSARPAGDSKSDQAEDEDAAAAAAQSTASEAPAAVKTFGCNTAFFAPTSTRRDQHQHHYRRQAHNRHSAAVAVASWSLTYAHRQSTESRADAAKQSLLAALRTVLSASVAASSPSSSSAFNNAATTQVPDATIVFALELAKPFLPDVIAASIAASATSSLSVAQQLWTPTFALRYAGGDALHFSVRQLSETSFRAKCYLSVVPPNVGSGGGVSDSGAQSSISSGGNGNISVQGVLHVELEQTTAATPIAAFDDLLWAVMAGSMREAGSATVALRKLHLFLRSPAVMAVMRWRSRPVVRVRPVPAKLAFVATVSVASAAGECSGDGGGGGGDDPEGSSDNSKATVVLTSPPHRRRVDAFVAAIDEMVERCLEEEQELQDVLDFVCDRSKLFYEHAASDPFYQHVVRRMTQVFGGGGGGGGGGAVEGSTSKPQPSSIGRQLVFSAQHLRDPSEARVADAGVAPCDVFELLGRTLLRHRQDTASGSATASASASADAEPITMYAAPDPGGWPPTGPTPSHVAIAIFGTVVDTVPANVQSVLSALLHHVHRYCCWIGGAGGENADRSGGSEPATATDATGCSVAWTDFCMQRAAMCNDALRHFMMAGGGAAASAALPASRDVIVAALLDVSAGMSLVSGSLFKATSVARDQSTVLVQPKVTIRAGSARPRAGSASVATAASAASSAPGSQPHAPQPQGPMIVLDVFANLELTERKGAYRHRVYTEFTSLFDGFLGMQPPPRSSSSSNDNSSKSNQHSAPLLLGRRLLRVFSGADAARLTTAPKHVIATRVRDTSLFVQSHISDNASDRSSGDADEVASETGGGGVGVSSSLGALNTSQFNRRATYCKQLGIPSEFMFVLFGITATNALAAMRRILWHCAAYKANGFQIPHQWSAAASSSSSSSSASQSEPRLTLHTVTAIASGGTRGSSPARQQLQAAEVTIQVLMPDATATSATSRTLARMDASGTSSSSSSSSPPALTACSVISESPPQRCRIPNPFVRASVRRVADNRARATAELLAESGGAPIAAPEPVSVDVSHVDFGAFLLRFYAESIAQLLDEIAAASADQRKQSSPSLLSGAAAETERDKCDRVAKLVGFVAESNGWSRKHQVNAANPVSVGEAAGNILYGPCRAAGGGPSVAVRAMAHPASALVEAGHPLPPDVANNSATTGLWCAALAVDVAGCVTPHADATAPPLLMTTAVVDQQAAVSFAVAHQKREALAAAHRDWLARHQVEAEMTTGAQWTFPLLRVE